MAEKRYELKRPSMFGDLAFMVALVPILVLLISLQDGFEADLLWIAPLTTGLLGLAFEAHCRATNYCIMHDDFLDTSRKEWGARAARSKTRVHYVDIKRVATDDEGLVVVDFRINRMEHRWSWPPVEYHGNIATLRFQPQNTKAVVRELERRIETATGRDIGVEQVP